MAFNTFDDTAVGSSVTLKVYLNSPELGLRLSRNRPSVIFTDSFVRLSSAYLAAGIGSSNIVPDIQYELRTTYGGYVAFVNNPYRSINMFTQSDIDQERVIFVHNGGETAAACGFDFHLSYGQERSKRRFRYAFDVYRAHIETINHRTLEVFPLGFEQIQTWHLSHRVRLEQQLQGDGTQYSNQRSSNEWRNTRGTINTNQPVVTVAYAVLSQPSHGRLIRLTSNPGLMARIRNEGLRNVKHFTQNDLDEGRIFYVFDPLPNTGTVQLHHQKRISIQGEHPSFQQKVPVSLRGTTMGLQRISDYILLNVSAYYSSGEKSFIVPFMRSHVERYLQFNISVSLLHINQLNQDRLFLIHPVIVTEGGTGEFTWANLNPQPLINLYEHNTLSDLNALRLRLVKPPEHGVLKLSDGSPFHEMPLTNNSIGGKSFRAFYVHDGSETLFDRFLLRLQDKNDPIVMGYNETGIEIPVHIKSVNDQRPRLIRPSSRPNHVHVSQTNDKVLFECLVGLTMVISDRWIYAVDGDSSASEILYELVSHPEFGALCLLPTEVTNDSLLETHTHCRPCTDPCLFSQEDVNENRLIYVAQYHPIVSPILDSFTFSVRDIHHEKEIHEQINPQGTVTLRLWPAEIIPQTNTIYLWQGEEWTHLNRNHVNITLRSRMNQTFTSDSVKPEWLWLTVVHPPLFGRLFLDTLPVLRFTFEDLTSGRMSYQQFSKASPTDSMVIRLEVDPWKSPSKRLHDMLTGYRSLTLPNEKHLFSEFSLYVEVKPRINLGDLVVEPGARITVGKEVFNTSALWNLIRQTTNVNKDVTSDVSPIVTFPTATQLRLGRFIVNGEVVVATGYPDEELSPTVNITLDSFDRGEVKFESYHLPDLQFKNKNELEEQIGFILWAGPQIQPARDLSSTGLHVLAPASVSMPTSSLAPHIREAAYTCAGQTNSSKCLRFSTPGAQTTPDMESTLACLAEKPTDFTKCDPSIDESLSLKTPFPAIDLSTSETSTTATLSLGAQPCLIQIAPYPTDTLTLTSVDSVPMWIAHPP
ncbi:unnamed protein product [Echinostoma caproni]|uniref:Glyco_hydro_38C domain-containing protein n=1 Tax=Echinostoma caproni TaxID=27848 RepID=A0A183ANX8_9TREM|nr:unnamed protein product [Echinostoma caproni]